MFPTTRWTLVAAAAAAGPQRSAALGELLGAYWRPLYCFARRKGLDAAMAEDAVQGFVVQLLERDFPGAVDPARGRLRGLLRTSFERFLINAHEREHARKRGGGARAVPLDAPEAERALVASPAQPEQAFDREWALSLMERALARLRREYDAGRRKGHADTVLRFFRADEAPSYAEAAAACGVTVPQFKASLHRARGRFRELVRAEVADTTGHAEVDDELRDLMRILGA